MSLLEGTLKKLSNDEVNNLLLDYQNKFKATLTRMNTDLSGLRQDLSDLKQNYIKLESELSVARQVNNKLKEHMVSLEFLDIQATIECGFTLKRVRNMTRTYSQMHRTDKYSEHSSIIWFTSCFEYLRPNYSFTVASFHQPFL